MYVLDLKKEFYEFLAGKRVFLMVHYDIDSICACKILQSLLKYRNILYTLAIVRGKEDLKRAYLENCEDVKYFVLINCGGTIDIVEELEAEDDIVFFILDSHRPIDLCNIYSTEQVRLLGEPEEDALVPEFDDIFRDESDSEDSDNDSENSDGENRAAKRRRLDEEQIMKRREKRLWEENKNKLLFEYSQFTYYARASAIFMFDFAWKLNKDDKDLLWLAIVALTEQLLLGKIENTQYTLEMESLRAHCKRLQNKTNDTDVQTSLKILFEKDLRLALYRHWTVEHSLKFSMFTAVKLKLWTLKGDKKIHELLADMGLPLIQSRQHFKSMDLQLRKEFHGSLEKLAEKYGLQDIEFTSFILQYGFRNKFCASDIVFALLAILEASPRDKKPEELFNQALDCLSRAKIEVINNAIERAKIIVKTLFKTVQSALDMKQIITAGPFVYYIIQEGCLDWYMFSHLHILSLLAQFILKAYVSMSRNRKASTLPLIVSAPKNIDSGTCILLGIPPVCENSPRKNLMDINSLIASQFHCHYKKLLIICTATATIYLIKRYIDKKRKSKGKKEKKKIKEFPTIEEIQKFIEDLPFDAVNSGKPVTLQDLLGELSEFSEDEDWKELIASVHSMYQDQGISDKQHIDTETGSVLCIYEDPNVVTLTAIEEFTVDNRGNGDSGVIINKDNSLESLLKNQGEGDKNEHA